MKELLNIKCPKCNQCMIAKVYEDEEYFFVATRTVETKEQVETEEYKHSLAALAEGNQIEAAKMLAKHYLAQDRNIKTAGFKWTDAIAKKDLNKLRRGKPEREIMMNFSCKCSTTFCLQLDTCSFAKLIKKATREKDLPYTPKHLK
ncbi:hypothetical protein HMPREF9306_01299 [Propionimicrobium lymphophilum ACS-093-V-SCH5]|uniref:Uncharacterized protein n=1 Tax=Propionimicrobium lymphophilum ACS-093-V-SCH5 TaxID=883161 RepID=S2W2N2_9ACTN|nr:hypothetical protein [Propionimicrobium lymphophilum]EPD32600.1 hypothetical protein HMPREF9306_01299 [Propionimicrobium lymphophilum ACS-093-V-SCH5]